MKETCFSCAPNGGSTPTACPECDNNQDGTYESCHTCSSKNNGIDDDCNSCRSSPYAIGFDSCKKCDTNGNGVLNACAVCPSLVGSNLLTACYMCYTNGSTTPNSCYQYDTNNDGVLDSCCPTFAVFLGFDQSFNGRSNSDAGIGETGTIHALAAAGQQLGNVTYSTSDPTCVSVSGTAWSAGDHSCTAQLCATVSTNGCKSCQNLTVWVPTGFKFIQRPGTGTFHEWFAASAGFAANIYVVPSDVSFSAVGVSESASIGDGTGYFLRTNGLPHTPWGPIFVATPTSAVFGSQVGGAGNYDRIYSGSFHDVPYADGTFTWPNNFIWTYQSASGSYPVPQKVVITPTGTMTTSKGGISVSANFSDPTNLNWP